MGGLSIKEGEDSIGLDKSDPNGFTLLSQCVFTKEFIEYQAQWIFESSPSYFGWSGEDEVLYTINRQSTKPQFLDNGSSTICFNLITDFPTSTTLVAIPSGTNIDVISTVAEVLRTNISTRLARTSIKLKDKATNWAIYRNHGTNSDLLLLSDGSITAPTIDSYKHQQDVFFRNTSVNWSLEFANISLPNLIQTETVTDFILITNSSSELLNYTIAQLSYGTFAEKIQCYTNKSLLSQTYSDLIDIKFPQIEIGSNVTSYGTETFESWTSPTQYNHIFLSQSTGTKDRLIVASFSLPEYIDFMTLVSVGSTTESIGTGAENVNVSTGIKITLSESWLTII